MEDILSPAETTTERTSSFLQCLMICSSHRLLFVPLFSPGLQSVPLLSNFCLCFPLFYQDDEVFLYFPMSDRVFLYCPQSDNVFLNFSIAPLFRLGWQDVPVFSHVFPMADSELSYSIQPDIMLFFFFLSYHVFLYSPSAWLSSNLPSSTNLILYIPCVPLVPHDWPYFLYFPMTDNFFFYSHPVWLCGLLFSHFNWLSVMSFILSRMMMCLYISHVWPSVHLFSTVCYYFLVCQCFFYSTHVENMFLCIAIPYRVFPYSPHADNVFFYFPIAVCLSSILFRVWKCSSIYPCLTVFLYITWLTMCSSILQILTKCSYIFPWLTFSIGPALRLGRFIVLMCLSVCLHICVSVPIYFFVFIYWGIRRLGV